MSLPRSLPASWYWSEAQYQLELERVWANEWLCIGRESDWQGENPFRRFKLGREQVIILRKQDGEFRAFFNTCRHRGAQLCQADAGQLERGRIRCPYHAWTYDMDGDLAGAPGQRGAEGFDATDYSLYPVALSRWRGFVFINLSASPEGRPEDTFDVDASAVAAWPLEDIATVHQMTHEVACNWKVFWENFLECYHCPGVHPSLCKLVPLYSQGVFDKEDLPPKHPMRDAVSPLKPGAVTWTPDGRTDLPWFEGLGEDEARAGMTYLDSLPGMFLVAHVDYVRTVRVMPLAPERTLLTVDWMVSPQVLEQGDIDIEQLTAMGKMVVEEDARICEINQQGLHCSRHQAGVLMPGEHDVQGFHDWLQKKLGATT